LIIIGEFLVGILLKIGCCNLENKKAVKF